MSLYCFKIFNELKRHDIIMLNITSIQVDINHNLSNNNLNLPVVEIYKFKQSVLKKFIYTWNN